MDRGFLYLMVWTVSPFVFCPPFPALLDMALPRGLSRSAAWRRRGAFGQAVASWVVFATCTPLAAAFLSGHSLISLGRPGLALVRSHGRLRPPCALSVICAATDNAGPEATPRRDALNLLGLGILSVLATGRQEAAAFDNAIPESAQWAQKPKRRGDAPKDLGVLPRSINTDSIDADPKTFRGLRPCDGRNNCFSTTGDDLLEDRLTKGFDTLIKPWLPPADDIEPFKTLVAEVKAYEPGQAFVDGGGFQVVKETSEYLYVHFEALKKGYIDDVEFYIKDGEVQVRSSSRVGSSDFGVNAKRLNYIAAGLREKGWDIDAITPTTHPDYFYAAADAADQTFDKDRRKGTEVENDRLQRPNFGNRAVLK